MGSTSGNLEIGDPGIAIRRRTSLVGGKIFVHIPESAIVDGVNRHTGVVTPLIRVLLISPTGLDPQFDGRECSTEVPPGGFDPRMRGPTGYAIADGGIAILILSYARHEAVEGGVGSQVAFLIDCRDSAAAEFIPPDSGLGTGVLTHPDGVAHQERFVSTEIPVIHTRHQPIADCVHVIMSMV